MTKKLSYAKQRRDVMQLNHHLYIQELVAIAFEC